MSDKITAPLLPSAEIGSENTLSGTLREVLRCHDISQHTNIPAKVVSYNRNKHTATVKILVKRAFNTTKGTQFVDWPEFEVPVLFQQQGGMLIDVPIYPGDTGYVVAGHRDGSTAIAKNSGITEAPSIKSSASSVGGGGSRGSVVGGGGSSDSDTLTATVGITEFSASPIGETAGTYTFSYNGSAWVIGHGTAVELSEYGIEVSGSPKSGASIKAVYTPPVGGAGGGVQLTVRQGSESSGGGSRGSGGGGGSSSSSSSSNSLTNGEKISRTLAGSNADIRSLLGTSKDLKTMRGVSSDIKSLAGTSSDTKKRLANDSRSLVGTNGNIKLLSGTTPVRRRIRQVVESILAVVKKTDRQIKQDNEENAAKDKANKESSSSSTTDTTQTASTQTNSETPQTENAGPQAPDTFLLHRYENGYFVPSRFGGVEIAEEDKLNLVIGNTRKVEDGKDENGKTKYKQEVFGKLTISRDGKVVTDAPAGYEVRADVDIQGQLVVDNGFCSVGDAAFESDVGVNGELCVGGDVSAEGGLEIGGESQLDQKLTVGKTMRKAIIDPHQDLRDGGAFDTARLRQVDIVTGLVSEDDDRVVYGTRKVIALATQGEKGTMPVYREKVVVKAGDNIEVDVDKTGKTTVYTIHGQEGGGGGEVGDGKITITSGIPNSKTAGGDFTVNQEDDKTIYVPSVETDEYASSSWKLLAGDGKGNAVAKVPDKKITVNGTEAAKFFGTADVGIVTSGIEITGSVPTVIGGIQIITAIKYDYTDHKIKIKGRGIGTAAIGGKTYLTSMTPESDYIMIEGGECVVYNP